MTINEIKKDLYKSKANAYFQRYDGTKAQLIYVVQLFGKVYQFPINAFQKKALTEDAAISLYNDNFDNAIESDKENEVAYLKFPADDLKGADFEIEVKGSLLIRWIEKALNSNDLICLEKEIEDVETKFSPDQQYGGAV